MATNGSKSLWFTDYDKLTFTWEQKSQSIENNTTVIGWKLELTSTAYGAIDSNVAKIVTVKFDGIPEQHTTSVAIGNYETKTLATGTRTIKHNTDGTKTFSYSCAIALDITFSGESIGTETISGTGTLNTIEKKVSILTAPDFNDEANPTITYSVPSVTSSATVQACISIDGSADDITYRNIDKTKSSYTFSLTDAERKVLRKATTGGNSRTVKFFIRTTINGTNYYSSLAKTFTIVNGAPVINPTVTDNDAQTKALTGDANKFIKYYSNASITTGAAAVKEASLASQKVVCGSKYITSATGTINDVETATFVFSATDNRGNTITKTVTKTLINYVKLTCNIAPQAPTTDGKTTVKISGNYFNGSFGATSNVLGVMYRYKTNSGSYGEWQTVTATASGNTYNVSISLSGLNYLDSYTFQARAFDKLATVDSAEKKVKTTPVFDWGENDFSFNVNVNCNENMIFDKCENAIRGTNSNGEVVDALKPCNGANVCALGYGNYTKSLGKTQVFGNNIELVAKENCYVNGLNILGLAKAITTAYTLDTSGTAGSNYSSVEVGESVLIGNQLRCYFNATRSTSTGAGNINNETVVRMTINHGGKIKTAYVNSFGNGSTGNVASFVIANATNNDTTLSFDVSLAATGALGNTFATYFILPVTLNLDAY